MTKTQSMAQLEVYHTTKQVAERLHKSEECIKKWFNRGLRRTKAGHSTLISETDLQDFLRRSTEEAA